MAETDSYLFQIHLSWAHLSDELPRIHVFADAVFDCHEKRKSSRKKIEEKGVQKLLIPAI